MCIRDSPLPQSSCRRGLAGCMCPRARTGWRSQRPRIGLRPKELLRSVIGNSTSGKQNLANASPPHCQTNRL
eukprot:9724062-Alexandrium_andersonii.AAC.1